MREDALRAVVQRRLTLESAAYELGVVQQPDDGRALSSPKRNARGPVRWPLDPPCVVELVLRDNDPCKTYLHSPYFFCTVELEPLNHEVLKPDTFTGSTVASSLHKVKMHDSREYGFFVFADLYVKYPGVYRLKFTAFEMRQGPAGMAATRLNWAYSKNFEIHPGKTPLTLRESTPLSKTLSEAGVKLRIRKEPPKRKSSKDENWRLRQAVAGYPLGILPPVSGAMPQHVLNGTFPSVSGGENITHRLSFQVPGPLGLRAHFNKQLGHCNSMPFGYLGTPALPAPNDQTLSMLNNQSFAAASYQPLEIANGQSLAVPHSLPPPIPNIQNQHLAMQNHQIHAVQHEHTHPMHDTQYQAMQHSQFQARQQNSHIPAMSNQQTHTIQQSQPLPSPQTWPDTTEASQYAISAPDTVCDMTIPPNFQWTDVSLPEQQQAVMSQSIFPMNRDGTNAWQQHNRNQMQQSQNIV